MTERFLNVFRESHFPNLTRDAYHVTSEETSTYNCIAHAAGVSDAPWWPTEAVGVHWPEGLFRTETLDAFVVAYEQLGYELCSSAELEEGFEKIALYVDSMGEPSHAARQLPHGSWTSKLGEWEDIEHRTLEALEGDQGRGYGKVVRLLKRPYKAK